MQTITIGYRQQKKSQGNKHQLSLSTFRVRYTTCCIKNWQRKKGIHGLLHRDIKEKVVLSMYFGPFSITLIESLSVLTCKQGKLSCCLAKSECVPLSSVFDIRVHVVCMLFTWGNLMPNCIRTAFKSVKDFLHTCTYPNAQTHTESYSSSMLRNRGFKSSPCMSLPHSAHTQDLDVTGCGPGGTSVRPDNFNKQRCFNYFSCGWRYFCFCLFVLFFFKECGKTHGRVLFTQSVGMTIL